MTNPLSERFPPDFLFGLATAAYQIEGAQGHNGDVACDHYHRWEEDLDLIKSMGADAYRFSIAWPRVIPDGRGAVNEAGLDFYDKLIDGIKERGLKVYPTLYHWDLPLALAGYGGWTDRDTADAFGEYTTAVMRRVGDRIDALATFNEPWCSTYLSHWIGAHAPGERSIDAALAAVHVTNLAHGIGVQAARAERADIPMGIVLNAQSIYPASDSKEDLAAAERSFQFHNGVFFGPLFNGAYDAEFEAALGDRLRVKEGDMDIIKQPLDWWGFNYYFPGTVKDDPSSENCLTGTGAMGNFNVESDPAAEFLSLQSVPSSVSTERTDMDWEIDAEGIAHLLRQVYDRYDLPPVFITENGACYNNGPGADGSVDDQKRLDYISDHLEKLAGCIDEGIPLKGYFAWSLMDNFEWAEGYKMRFGLVYVDYETQKRTIKKSGLWYRDLSLAHAQTRTENK